MTLSVLMYAMMMATFLALAGVLVFDAVTAVLRWSAHRTAQSADRTAPRAVRPRQRPQAGATG